jgi:transposase
MVIFGIDAHKRTHTAVAVDEQGRKLGERSLTAISSHHLALLAWAERFGPSRLWAVEDCRHLSRRLEQDFLAAGETIVRVPPKMMAHSRDAARSFGKSDPIDALAVARAALREPQLPTARLDGPDRDIRLLLAHREDLVAERTRIINRLRWHLHEIDPTWEPPARGLIQLKHQVAVERRLEGVPGLVPRLSRELLARCRELTTRIGELRAEIEDLVTPVAPSLLAVNGCAALSAAKIIGETAGIQRFRSKDAFARHNGTAPIPVWSANRVRHRLNRAGNRQLNAALHRIALTQARHDPQARVYLDRRRAAGNTTTEAMRCLKRRLSDVVYRALLADAVATPLEQRGLVA